MKDSLLLLLTVLAFAVAGAAYQVGFLKRQERQNIQTQRAVEQAEKWAKLANECAAQRLIEGLNLSPNKK